MEKDLVLLLQISNFYGGKIFKEGLTEIIIPKMAGIEKETERYVKDIYFLFENEKNSLNFVKLLQKRNIINPNLKNISSSELSFQKNNEGYYIRFNNGFICRATCNIDLNWCALMEHKLFYFNDAIPETGVSIAEKNNFSEYLKKGTFLFYDRYEHDINTIFQRILQHKYSITPLLFDFLEREVRTEYVYQLLRSLLFYYSGNSNPIFTYQERKKGSSVEAKSIGVQIKSNDEILSMRSDSEILSMRSLKEHPTKGKSKEQGRLAEGIAKNSAFAPAASFVPFAEKQFEVSLSDADIPENFQNYIYFDFITRKRYNIIEWKFLENKPIFWKRIVIPENAEELLWIIHFIKMKVEKNSKEKSNELPIGFYCWGCIENSLAQIDHCGVNGCLSQ